MATITDISTQKKRDTRATIYLDGRFYCGLEKMTVINADLKIGQEISTQQIEQLQLKSESLTAFDKAVRYLSSRARTQKQIEKYLLSKGYLLSTIASVTDKLSDYKYINDEQYCLSYIAAYRNKMGVKKIEMELRSAGVSNFTIADSLEGLGDQTDEAVRVGEKYLRSRDFDSNKLYNFLYGKGFDYSTIKSAIKQIEINIEESENNE